MSEPVVGTFDVLAASVRADTGDLRSYLDVVAGKLSDALPGSVRVEREGGLFARERRVRRVNLQLAGRTYELAWTGADLVASIGGRVLPLADWAEDLGNQLSQHARNEARAKDAMSGLLEGRLPVQSLTRPAGPGILARHPAQRFALDSTIDVGPGDSAVLVVGGEVGEPLGAGTHTISDALPAAAPVDPGSDEVTGTLYFASTAERPNQRFGGSVDKVLDPQTGLAVGLRVFGEYSLKVSDPAALVRTLGSQADVSDQRITDFLRDIVLKVLRKDLAAHVTEQGWPVLGLAAHADELEQAALERLRGPSAEFGLAVVRFGNFTVSMKEEDEALVTERHAHPLATSGPPANRLDPAAQATRTCAACGATNLAAARFCSNCGRPLANRCAGCGTENAPGARFCNQCGAALPGGAS